MYQLKKYIICVILIIGVFFIPLHISAKETQTIITNFDEFAFSKKNTKKTLKVKTSSNLPVKFLSSNPKAASIDSSGVIHARASGASTIVITQEGNDQYERAEKRVKVVVPKTNTRNEALKPWFEAMIVQAKWDHNTRYNWTKPTIANSRHMGTCITMPNVCLQRVGIFKPREWVAASTNTGRGFDLINRSIKKLKKHPGYFEWYTPYKRPKPLVDSGQLIIGDIVGVGGHTQVFMGKNSKGHLVWNTSGQTGSGRSGVNSTAIKKRTPYYERQTVGLIVRIKTHYVRASCTNGNISGSNLYMAGQTAKITYSPKSGYTLKSVIVDGKNVTASHPNSYTFRKINKVHQVSVVYKKAEDSLPDDGKDQSDGKDNDYDENIPEDLGPPNIDLKLIQKWAQESEKFTSAHETGCTLIPDSVKKIKNLFSIIQVLGILLLVILTIIEFVKVITGAEDEGLKKAIKHTLIRVFLAILLLMLPQLVSWLLTITNVNIGGKDDPLCLLSIFKL